MRQAVVLEYERQQEVAADRRLSVRLRAGGLLRNARGKPPPENRGDESLARIGEGQSARLQHVAREEESGQREAVGDVVRRRRGPPPTEMPAGGTAGPARARRRRARPRGRTSATHSPDRSSAPVAAQLARSRPKPSSTSICNSKRTISAPAVTGSSRLLEHRGEMVVHLRVRIALRQQPAQRRKMGHAIDHMRGGKLRGAMQMQRLDRVMPEMLVEPRAPDHAHGVARLQQRAQPRAAAAANEAEMAAVLARHHFEDGVGLAVPPRAQHDAVIGPFHEPSLSPEAESSTPLQRQRPWIFALRLLVVDDEAGRAVGRGHRFRRGAALKHREIACLPIEQIGMDQVAAGAVGEIAEPVDLALGARIGGTIASRSASPSMKFSGSWSNGPSK